MKRFISLLTIFTMLPFVAHAEIASKAYVDDSDKIMIYGTNNPNADDVSDITNAGGVKGYVDSLGDDLFNENDGAITELQNTIGDIQNDVSDLQTGVGDAITVNQSLQGGFLATDQSGVVNVVTGSFISNDYIAPDAEIALGKLKLPTPPQACSTRGCMLMFYNNQYIWEPVTRDNNETIANAGGVDAPVYNYINVVAVPADTVGGIPQLSGCSTNADCDRANGYRCVNGLCQISFE